MTTAITILVCLLCLCTAGFASAPPTNTLPRTWTADNGDGTFSNPLFYDEFSDPDLIRVGDDYYLTGTTMHTMPGLPVLHSRDLVNWQLVSYACDRLDLGPEYRLEGGKEAYGQGIWAPCFRYHKGTYYIFTNVNRQATQVFRATNPAGPWKRGVMKRGFHDLSVLFDDDDKAYIVWGYRDIHFARLNDDLTDVVPGTERSIIPADAGMGEGSHFYKIDGKYYITSAWYMGVMRMPCARAEGPEGPYEVNRAISEGEDFGTANGAMHQGGIVRTSSGEWWGYSMMDLNSVGRLTGLSPVTWKDGWPYFGLPGNLGRTPRTWVKPDTGHPSPPAAPYERSDDFSRPKLKPVWQWNHVPDDAKWSLAERPGFLRLHALPASDFWHARNSLTQRVVGPECVGTAELDPSGMAPGGVAGLALLNAPYAWVGAHRGADGTLTVEQFDQRTGETASIPLPNGRVWLRAHCDFRTEKARFFYSTNGRNFAPLGAEFAMVYQLKTFQGVRFALFHYGTDTVAPVSSGHADFAGFTLDEPSPHGRTQPIPFGRDVFLSAVGGPTLSAKNGVLAAVPDLGTATRFRVVDRGKGRVALRASNGGYLSVSSEGRVVLHNGDPTDAETFQWIETMRGDLALLSLATHRYLRIDPDSGRITADHPGPQRGRPDGSRFVLDAATTGKKL